MADLPLPGPNPLIFPVVMTKAGVQPQPPANLLSQLIALVTYGTDPTGAVVMTPDPGYTAGLPGSLIEDIASTDTATMVLADQARAELINSLTPYGANAFILNQLGQAMGVPAGIDTNMSVAVVFSGTTNYIIQAGFQVSDGTHTYIVQDPGVVGSGGASLPLTAVAAASGIWPIPANSVTALVTSLPGGITLTVNNPLDGIAGTVQETEQQYRLRVQQAQRVTCQGTAAFLKTLLGKVPGIVATQVAVQSVQGGGFIVVAGGSNPDPVQIAGAIYLGTPDVGMLQGSILAVTAITQANPGKVTVSLNHLYADGQVVTFSGVGGMTSLNTGSYTVTVVDEKSFTIGIDTTGLPAYTSGGVVAPNLRNNQETINDYPDNYVIPWVTPPKQIVNVDLTWNTASPFASGAVFDQTAQTAIINYLNAIPAGAPINLFAMEEAVQAAVADLLPLSQLSRMVWTVAINSVSTSPVSGTGLIFGDPQGYFSANAGTVTVVQG